MLIAREISWTVADKNILQKVNLELQQGEIVGLVGPNGSGKSSLLKVLAFLQKPTTGKLFFQGEEVTDPPPLNIRRRIAIVFQEPLLLNASVYENVAVGLKIRGMSGTKIASSVEHWLEQFGVAHLSKDRSHYLSGGEAQRVSLARAFALEPDLLLLDEPFSALDTPTKSELLTDLNNVFHKTKTTAVVVSHDFHDIECLTKRAVMMVGGSITANGCPRDLRACSFGVRHEMNK
ncbi:MAG TPA: ATP-binding cassette domain-containing protein [Desulfobacteria bacterium]|nr:ATP-binding cassette domain-containing protein [Desulfobacteria bacterium]